MRDLARLVARGLAAALCLVLLQPASPARAQESVTVLAAASLREALDEVAGLFSRETGVRVVASYAASSALARQLDQGAPADLFASADTEWMDWAAERRLIRPASRVDLLGNTLVLIAPADSPLAPVAIARGFDPLALAGNGRIATTDGRVPAGRYAREALTWLGQIERVTPRLASGENVRATLQLVARGEAPLGIVYATDARAETRVKVIGTFPAESHSPIIYPFAATARANPAAERFLAFVRGPEAGAVFERHGFALLALARR